MDTELFTEEYYAAESVARSAMALEGVEFGTENDERDAELHARTLAILEGN